MKRALPLLPAGREALPATPRPDLGVISWIFLLLAEAASTSMAVETGDSMLADAELIALPGVGPYTASAVACFAADARVGVAWERLWHIEPRPFHPELIDLCDEANHLYHRAHD